MRMTAPIYSAMVPFLGIGVLLPNYPEENIVKGENVPNFKMNTGKSDGTSNIFQILQDL